MMRMNIDDGDIFIGEFANGALGSIQTSFVTVGNYPGHRGAHLRHRRARSSAGWSRKSASASGSRSATPDEVEFKRARPSRPSSIRRAASREESWRSLFYANLVSSFINEILSDGAGNEGNFDDGAWVQETINAVEQSFRERRWVTLPLA